MQPCVKNLGRTITTASLLCLLHDAWTRDAKLTVTGLTKKLTGREQPEKRHFQRAWRLAESMSRRGLITLVEGVASYRPRVKAAS